MFQKPGDPELDGKQINYQFIVMIQKGMLQNEARSIPLHL